MNDTKAVVLKSLGISYIYSLIVDKVDANSELMRNFLLILLSLMVAYMAYLSIKSEMIAKMLEALDIETTFWDNEIEALQGVNKGAWLVVYLKNDNICYEGNLHYKEMEPCSRQYITLNGYRKYLLDGDGDFCKCIDDFANNLNEEVVLFYEDIRKIEKR